VLGILANQVYFRNQGKLVIVAYERPDKLNLSIRGKGASKLTNKIIETIEGTTGGGHKEATGAMIPSSKIEEFEKLIKGI
jgi:nanoRNase/pAp phosphatase (c-di-AMP/oligoRNAs hydrolase)